MKRILLALLLLAAATAQAHPGIGGCKAVDQGGVSYSANCAAQVDSFEQHFSNHYAAGTGLSVTATAPCFPTTASNNALMACASAANAQTSQLQTSQVRIRRLSCVGVGVSFDASDSVDLCLTQITTAGAETAVCDAGERVTFDTDGSFTETKVVDMNVLSDLSSGYVFHFKHANIDDTTAGSETFRVACLASIQVP